MAIARANAIQGASSRLLQAASNSDWLQVGGDGNDTLTGGAGDDILVGGNGNDTLSGGAGTNIIDGGTGDDLIDSAGETIILGGGGSDRYRVSDFSAAVDAPDIFRDFQVGYGGDILDLSWAIAAVDPRNETPYPWTLDPVHPFESGLIRVIASGKGALVQVDLSWIGKGQGYGTMLFIENVSPEQLTAFNFNPPLDPLGRNQGAIGTNGDDVMKGSLEGDLLSGLGGDDEIAGGEGEDRIDGGDGNDTLFGGEHADTIFGGDGDDHIYGDPAFWGGDRWSPPPKPGGADFIDGGAGNDNFYEWRADGSPNTIIGGAGDDTFHYVSSMPEWGGYEFWPVEGSDLLTGGEGRDTYRIGMLGDSPADIVTDFEGGPSGDVIDVSEMLIGLPGYIVGTSPFVSGHLVLEQSDTSTVLKALTYTYSGLALRTVLTLQNTNVGDLTPDNFVPPYDPSVVFGAVIGTAGADSLAGTRYPEFLDGLDGDDIIKAHGGDDRLEGGAGNDRLSGGDGNDRIYGEDGDDRLQGDNGNDTLEGGAGDDLIMEVEGHHAAGPNDEMIWGGSGNDTIHAGAGNDYADGGHGDDHIFGGTGDDTLFDIAGANRIDGGSGNDTILMVSYNWFDPSYPDSSQRPGIDEISGGPGADRFSVYFLASRPLVVDRILDFETGPGGDVIDLSSMMQALPGFAGDDPFIAGLLRLTASGDDTLLEARLSSAGFSSILVLENTSPERVTPANIDWLL